MLKVSVITVTYNSADTIEECIRSVALQTHPAIEHIIVDGLSTDGTLAKVENLRGSVSHLVSEPDQGIYDAMNKGLALASGDIICYLNSDDFYADKEVISNVVHLLEAHHVDSVYADIDYVDRKRPGHIIRKWRSGEYHRENFYNGWMPPHPAFFVKSGIYKKFGGYRVEQDIAADYELMLRFLFRHNVSCAYLPKVVVKMRTGGVSNGSFLSLVRQNIQNRRAWKINNLRPRWYTLILKPLSKIRQYIK